MSANADVLGRFWELVAEVNRIDTEELETDIEPWLEAVLSHVLAYPDARPQFADAFLQILRENKGPDELVEFCMHALRWSEVKNDLAAWLEHEDSERTRHALRSLIKSFGNDWHGASSYSRFSTATP